MSDLSFEAAVQTRVDEMVDACTRCGKCVEACPSVKPAGLASARQRTSSAASSTSFATATGPDASRKWAQACTLSGECITACDEGVNPRFLLAMARVAIAKANHDLPARRRQGVEKYRDLSRDVSMLSQLQLNDEVLARLGQKSASVGASGEPPDFVFYTGCNVLKTPHIALLALDIMDALGIALSGDGRTQPLLRRCADASRRSRNVRTDGNEQHRETVAYEIGSGDFLVSELLRPVHRNHPARARTPARRAPVRDDAVHALPRWPARPAHAAFARALFRSASPCTAIPASPG